MIALYTLSAVLLILLPNIVNAELKCKYGEQIVCGSDGYTYKNQCDLDIVRSVRPHLTVKHSGTCLARKGRLLETLTKILNMQKLNFLNGMNVLRHTSKDPRCPEPRLKLSSKRDFTKILLAQMANSQTNLDAFNFNRNTINTQGDGNQFKINVG